MALLPPLDKDTASDSVREALAVMSPDVAVFPIVANAQTAFRPWLMLQHAINSKLSLDPRLKELAILRVAFLAGCDYERVQHEVVARIDGVAEEQISALAAGAIDGPAFDERERLVLRFVTEVVEGQGAGEELTREAIETLSPQEVVELLLTVSHYHGLALLLNTLRVDPDPPLDAEVILATRARREALANQA